MLGNFTLSDRIYQWVKKSTTIVLPAVTTAYLGLSDVWDLPEPDKVAATNAIVCTFLGALLALSSKNYTDSGAQFDGNLVMDRTADGIPLASIEPDVDLEDLANKDCITLKITQAGQTTDP